MVYDERLAERVAVLTDGRPGFTNKKMFGGKGFLLNGNMCVGVWKEFLILRLGIEPAELALTQPHVVEFDITGKSLRGWVMVEPDGVDMDIDLKAWVEQAEAFVSTLPAANP